MKPHIVDASTRPTRITVIVALAASIFAGWGVAADDAGAPGASTDAKRDRYLLLYSRVVESAENARLTPGKITKCPDNPLITEDRAWERQFNNLYPSVLYDSQDKRYKLWYNLFIVNPSAKGMTWEERESRPYRHSRIGVFT